MAMTELKLNLMSIKPVKNHEQQRMKSSYRLSSQRCTDPQKALQGENLMGYVVGWVRAKSRSPSRQADWQV